jgi:hypothetical protein
MNHKEALRVSAVERYVLDEMDSHEREAFEEHYFACPECAEALTDSVTLADNAREVFKDRKLFRIRTTPGRWAWLNRWLMPPALAPTLVASALLVVVGYLALITLPKMNDRLRRAAAPQPILAFALHAASRGAGQAIEVPRDATYYTVYVDLPASSTAVYFCEIRDAAGRLRDALTVPQSETTDALNLLLSTARIPPGDYTLVVRAAPSSRSELERYRFTVKFK